MLLLTQYAPANSASSNSQILHKFELQISAVSATHSTFLTGYPSPQIVSLKLPSYAYSTDVPDECHFTNLEHVHA